MLVGFNWTYGVRPTFASTFHWQVHQFTYINIYVYMYIMHVYINTILRPRFNVLRVYVILEVKSHVYSSQAHLNLIQGHCACGF